MTWAFVGGLCLNLAVTLVLVVAVLLGRGPPGLSDDDPEMPNGWQSIPIPPTDDPAWFILESRDYKSVWGRWRIPLEVEGTA